MDTNRSGVDLGALSVFEQFLASNDTLWVYEGSKRLFHSARGGIAPLIEYIERGRGAHRDVAIFDKIMGNAAALLAVKAGCRAVYSPLGSRFAVETLDRHHVVHHITNVVPYICRPTLDDMCPMERLSIGKDPETFYAAVKGG